METQPSGVLKHFAAIVERDGTDYYFACQEDQTIDFNAGTISQLKVKRAVFGALAGSPATEPEAADVTGELQAQIDRNNGVVQISTTNLGDPAPGNVKHFAAIVERNGTNHCFACQENQTIDFNS